MKERMLTKEQLEKYYEKMTFEERLGQLLQLPSNYFGQEGELTGIATEWEFTEDEVRQCGSILNCYGVERLSAVQKEHLKHSGVPMMFMGDVTAGYSASQPIPLSQACSFDPELVKKLCASAAKGAAAHGISATFSPVVDICRDARWGRVCESYGEDVYLSSQMAAAAVEGYQNENEDPTDRLSACVKHFAAYGYPEDGKDYNNVEISERTLRSDYLKGYRAAVDAGCDMVMTSFNCIGGIPATVNPKLLNGILREEWGFQGVTISDWGSMLRCKRKGAINDEKELAYYGALSKVDIDMVDYLFTKYWPEMIKNGILDEKLFKESVIRVLELKNKHGLLENPYAYLTGKNIDYKEHYEIAKNAAHECCVLLENKDEILPIGKNEKIALVGPYAVKERPITFWSRRHCEETDALIKTPKQAFEQILEREVPCERGCPLLEEDNHLVALDAQRDPCYDDKDGYWQRAVQTAAAADKVIVMIGEHYEHAGESNSRSDLTIPEIQLKLLEAIQSVNPNIISVVYSARPLDLRRVKALSKAILFAWLPGDGGSEAVAELLCGKAVPSAKLSMSMPYCVGQMPLRYGNYQDGTDRNTPLPKYNMRYVDAPNQPLYSFGYGLSYTTFSYSDIRVSNQKFKKNNVITASVTLTNTGKREGTEVVQMYLQDLSATLVVRPFRELKGFRRVFLQPGESVQVKFEITEKDLRFVGYHLKEISEPGLHKIFIGGSSDTLNAAEFEYLGE